MGTSSNSSSLADGLFTQVQQRVLGVLFGRTERSFYLRELMALADVGRGAVQREVRRLLTSGLITETRIGNQKHYQANPGSPVFAELTSIVMKTVGLVGPIRDALAPLSHQIDAAFVYGSVAQGEDSASSDIDLLVISDELTHGELFGALEDVANRLGRAVNPSVYSYAEIRKRATRGNAFVRNVLDQPKLWVIGSSVEIGA